MTSFTKVFDSMLDSTVWLEPNPTRLLWVTMMLMADQDGIVSASVPGLAHRARITREECEAGLKRFMEPDADSRTPDDDGRRIRKVDGGWQLVNHAKYRRLMSPEDQKEKARLRKRRQRAKEASEDVTPGRDAGVTCHASHVCHDIAEAEAKAEAEKKTHVRVPLTEADAEQVYVLYPKQVGRRAAIKAILAAVNRLIAGEYKQGRLTVGEALAVLKNSTDLFARSPAGNRGKFTPHPATWFNKSRYLDDQAEWNQTDEHAINPSKAEQRTANNLRAYEEAVRGLDYATGDDSSGGVGRDNDDSPTEDLCGGSGGPKS
jgi:hypothetical protein